MHLCLCMHIICIIKIIYVNLVEEKVTNINLQDRSALELRVTLIPLRTGFVGEIG